MTENDIKEILENLGNKVSILAEENRILKDRENACRKLFTLLDGFITKDDWAAIYQSTDDFFIKELMSKWGSKLFPKDFEK